MSNNKKKHHVVPATYLAGFSDNYGKLYEYRKDDPKNPNYNFPRELGHKRYYFSQPTPDGGKDNNTLEDFFNKELECKWPSFLQKVCNKDKLDKEDYDFIFPFIAMLRVRVPAARDYVEHNLVQLIRNKIQQLDKGGNLPPRSPIIEDLNLSRDLAVSVDPHQSIHAMVPMINIFSNIINLVGYRIYKNNTDLNLITTDNLVIYFDPDVPEDRMNPYSICSKKKRVGLIFPIDSHHLLHGHSDFRIDYIHQGIFYGNLNSTNTVRRFNRLVCKFGYEKIFSCNRNHDSLIYKYSGLSPVALLDSDSNNDNEFKLLSSVFGERSKLPKWKSEI